MTMPSTASAVTTTSFSQNLEDKATISAAVDFVDDSSADRALMFLLAASAEEGAKEQVLRRSAPIAWKRRSGPMETSRGGGSLCLNRSPGWQGAECGATGGRCERGAVLKPRVEAV